MFNFLNTIWSFVSNIFSTIIDLAGNFLQILSICIFPFRWTARAISSFGSMPVVSAFMVLMFLGVILTLYRIIRGTI